MAGVFGLIPNFAGGLEAGSRWRLCASSRLANHRSVFHGFKASPERVSTLSGKCQRNQERRQRKQEDCQLVQYNDCQPHQEISKKLSTKIRKRHGERGTRQRGGAALTCCAGG